MSFLVSTRSHCLGGTSQLEHVVAIMPLTAPCNPADWEVELPMLGYIRADTPLFYGATISCLTHGRLRCWSNQFFSTTWPTKGAMHMDGLQHKSTLVSNYRLFLHVRGATCGTYSQSWKWMAVLNLTLMLFLASAFTCSCMFDVFLEYWSHTSYAKKTLASTRVQLCTDIHFYRLTVHATCCSPSINIQDFDAKTYLSHKPSMCIM